MLTPKKFLNNRDILREIHASKASFCSFVDPDHHDYDEIVEKRSQITPKLLAEVRLRLSRPRGKPNVDIETIDPETIVFRLMTDEHVPISDVADGRRKAGVAMRTSFPPYKHYLLKNDGSLVEVCRSHWAGGIENGHFSNEHGKPTRTLALMWMKLVERLGRRGNYSGYSYLEEMQGQALMQLSQVGLQFNEAKSDNPFAFYTTVMNNCFRRVLNLEKKSQSIRDTLLQNAGANPSYTRQSEMKAITSGPA